MEDHFTHEAEIGYQIRESFYALSVYGATESSDDSDTPLEGRIKIRVNLIQEIILETYILKGFSDGTWILEQELQFSMISDCLPGNFKHPARHPAGNP